MDVGLGYVDRHLAGIDEGSRGDAVEGSAARLDAISWRNRAPVVAGQRVVYAVADDLSWSASVDGSVVADGTLALRDEHDE